MSTRSILILCSLAANVALIFVFSGSLKRVQQARQLMMQQDGDITRLREAAQRFKPGEPGLSSGGLMQEVVLLQKVKTAVAAELSKNRARNVKCLKGASSEMGLILSSIADYKKKLDIVIANKNKNARNREEMVKRVEEEARKMKLELMVACAGR